MSDPTPNDPTPTVVVSTGPDGYRTEVTTTHGTEQRSHTIIADVPPSKNGNDDGPSPHDLLLGSLGACKAMTAKMYADRKGWPLERIAVALVHHEPDTPNGPQRITAELQFEGDLSEDQRDRLAAIAERCPVQKAITGELAVESSVVANA